MKILELLEARNYSGAVISMRNGKVYDLDFVDYESYDKLEGHFGNLGDHFIAQVRERDAWESVMPFFRKHFKVRKMTDADNYSSEDADFFLVGPISDRAMNHLDEMMGINESVDLSMNDSIDTMKKYKKELQAELVDAKKDGDKDAIKQLEKDLADVSDMITRKK